MIRTVVDGPAELVESGQVLLSCGHQLPSAPRTTGSCADCDGCDRRELPELVTKGRRTRAFTADTVPAALLSDHRTNAWASLVVTSGSVTFREDDPPWEATANAQRAIVIVPGRPHRISPSPDAVFAVQFFDLPPTLSTPTQPQEGDE